MQTIDDESLDESDDWSDFECPECREELDEDDVCENEECDSFGQPIALIESDRESRQHERKQMGVGL